MNNEHGETVKAVAQALIERMGFVATVEVTPPGGAQTTMVCAIHVTEGQNFLIGQYGMNLAALQHVVRILVRRKLGEKLDIVVDINDYFRDKKQILEKEAAQGLEEALQNNVSVTLRPMLPYERKVVHSFLSGHEGVLTESVGQGDERKVMIVPRPSPSA